MTSRVSGRRACKVGERLEQQVEALLRLEPADGAEHVVTGLEAERRADLELAGAIARELAMIDAVEHGRDPSRVVRRDASSSRAISLDTAISRGNRASTRLSAG